MIFIIEGPDGAGKSTLAKELSEQFNMPIIKMNKPEKYEEAHMFEYYLKLIAARDYFILDRCWYSELVYGAIMPDRAKSCITVEQNRALEKAIAGNAIIIHCTSSVATLWKRCNARGEKYVTEFAQMLRIKDGYETLFESTGLPVFRYEYKD